MSEASAVRMFVFVTRGDGLLAKLIARVTGEWTHMGLGFELSDNRRVYYEALFGKGVQGPKPLSELEQWAAARPGRRYALRVLPGMDHAAGLKRVIVNTYKDVAGYGELQILSMWFFERVGRRFGWRAPRSRSRIVCSELVARVLMPEFDLRDAVRRSFDEVNPTSAWVKLLSILRQRSNSAENGQGAQTQATPRATGGSSRCNGVAARCSGNAEEAGTK